jgi:hypothetical protein
MATDVPLPELARRLRIIAANGSNITNTLTLAVQLGTLSAADADRLAATWQRADEAYAAPAQYTPPTWYPSLNR